MPQLQQLANSAEHGSLSDSVVKLATLGAGNADELAASGRRVWTRVEAQIEAAHADKRRDRLYELMMRELSYELACGRVSSEDDAKIVEWVGERVRSKANALANRRPGLDGEPGKAVDVWLDADTDLVIEQYERKEEEPRSREEIRAELWSSWDPGQPNYVAEAAWMLAQELDRRLREPDRVRRGDEWWEIAALILTVEWPDLDTDALGIDAELPWGEWDLPGGSLFEHRDGMRDYMEFPLASSERHRREGWERYVRTAEMAAQHLGVLHPIDAAADVRLVPVDEEILLCLMRADGRLKTAEIARGCDFDTKSIGKNLAELKASGLLENPGRQGYALTPIGRTRAERVRRERGRDA